MQTQRDMADEIIATMQAWDMPKIYDAMFDEATGHVVFRLNCRNPLFELRFSVPESADASPADREIS